MDEGDPYDAIDAQHESVLGLGGRCRARSHTREHTARAFLPRMARGSGREGRGGGRARPDMEKRVGRAASMGAMRDARGAGFAWARYASGGGRRQEDALNDACDHRRRARSSVVRGCREVGAREYGKRKTREDGRRVVDVWLGWLPT